MKTVIWNSWKNKNKKQLPECHKPDVDQVRIRRGNLSLSITRLHLSLEPAPYFCLSFCSCQSLKIFLENLFLFKNLFLSPIALPWYMTLCVCVCVCVVYIESWKHVHLKNVQALRACAVCRLGTLSIHYYYYGSVYKQWVTVTDSTLTVFTSHWFTNRGWLSQYINCFYKPLIHKQRVTFTVH